MAVEMTTATANDRQTVQLDNNCRSLSPPTARVCLLRSCTDRDCSKSLYTDFDEIFLVDKDELIQFSIRMRAEDVDYDKVASPLPYALSHYI